MPRLKRYLSEVKAGIVPQTLWKYQDVGHTQEAKKELLERVKFSSSDSVFDTPKPTRLIERMLRIATKVKENDIVMDFFAGSGATGDAIVKLNTEDGGNRKFILVQLPEPTGYSDYKTIAEITKERIRHVIKKLNDEEAAKLNLVNASKKDRGFRVFKLSESNFKPWNANVRHDAPAVERQLEVHVDHIREGGTADDLLYEILIKSWPSALTTPIEKLVLAGKTVHSVAGGLFFICLERELTLELIRAMADKKPERVVCLDEGFAGNDQLKANAVQIFKTKGVTSFKTV